MREAEMRRTAAVLMVVALALAACSGVLDEARPEPDVTAAPAGSAPPDLSAFAVEACAGTRFTNCVSAFAVIAGTLDPGTLIAICEYPDRQGDLALIEREDEAMAGCSGGGLIRDTKVAKVVAIP
jgi:hypothetical protein